MKLSDALAALSRALTDGPHGDVEVMSVYMNQDGPLELHVRTPIADTKPDHTNEHGNRYYRVHSGACDYVWVELAPFSQNARPDLYESVNGHASLTEAGADLVHATDGWRVEVDAFGCAYPAEVPSVD